VPTLREIADALADSLDAVAWSGYTGLVTVDRKTWPDYRIEDLASARISVATAGVEATRISRTAHQHDKQLAVWIAKAVDTEAEADEMLDWAEEIAETIEDHDWATVAPLVTWPAGVTSPQDVTLALNPDDGLQDRNVWRAVVAVAYRIPRAH
jgi:hypothetical protein